MSTTKKRSRSDEEAAISEIRKKHAPQIMEFAKKINEAVSGLMAVNEKMCADANKNGEYDDYAMDCLMTFDTYASGDGGGTSFEDVLCMSEKLMEAAGKEMKHG